jgi:lipopolysaccharide assembly outer membrane protein LptD (OstA)
MRKSWLVFGLALAVLGLAASAQTKQSYFVTVIDPTFQFHASVPLRKGATGLELRGRADGREITPLHNIVYRGNVVISIGEGAEIRADRAVLSSSKDDIALSGNVRLSLK